jgi:hypothetical protein
LHLTGHADAWAISDGELRVLDFKTGREDSDFGDQLRAYAWLLMEGFPESPQALAIVVRLREMTQDVYRWSRAELNAWYEGVVRDTADVERFRAGRHCSWCQRRVECVSRACHIAASAAALRILPSVPDREDLVSVDDDTLVALHDRIRNVEGACEAAREQLRGWVGFRGGSVTASDGRTLALVRQERREVNAAAAWEILTDRFGDKVLDAAKLSKSAVERLAMDAAPRGTKGVAAKQLIEELDRQGAVTVTTIERLECSRHGTSNSDSIEAGDAAVSRPAIANGTTGQTDADDA